MICQARQRGELEWYYEVQRNFPLVLEHYKHKKIII